MNNLVSTLNPKSVPYRLNDDWTWYKWEDIIEYYQQGLIRSNSELNSEYGIDYFKMSFINQDGSYSFNKLPKTKATDKEIKDYRINSGDFFINVRNSKELVGKSCVIYRVDKDILFNHMLVRIKHKQHITGSYINAYFNTDFGKKLLDTCKKGTTTVIALYQKDLYDLPIPIPNEDILKQIDSTYNSINQKIEINNRINAELEAMAKTVYDYWFVQFDFPFDFAQGKPSAEGKPYKSSGGKMVWSEELKREVPEGWEVDNLLKVSNLEGGGTPNKAIDEYWNGEISFYTPSDYTNSLFVMKTESSITKIGLKNCSSKLFPKGSIFITARGTVGNVSIASENMAMNQSCYAFCEKKEYSYCYLYYTVSSLINVLKAKSGGSVFNSIVSNDIKHTKLPIPPENVSKEYKEICDPIFSKILVNQQENQQLSSLRDWLLPMLMNGQMKVGEDMESELSMAAEPKTKYGK